MPRNKTEGRTDFNRNFSEVWLLPKIVIDISVDYSSITFSPCYG